MNTKKIFHYQFTTYGFIMVEAIVAISVLMFAIPAALTVASKSVFLGSYSKDQVIATYLAQEGFEIIRNKRDENMLQNGGWTDGISGANNCGVPQRCIVDYGVGVLSPRIQKCVGSCSMVLQKNTSPSSPYYGTYSHNSTAGWTPTQFSRYVQVEDVNPNEIRVTSVVTYTTRGISRNITLTVNITRWIL